MPPLFVSQFKNNRKMKNVNIELFKRTAPVKKIDIIKNLTQNELNRISEDTIIRIIKEAGRRLNGTRDYEFYVNPDIRKGNNWNSEVEGMWLYKGELSIMLYVQFDNTDTVLIVPFNEFFRKGDFRKAMRRDDWYGNLQTHYFVYDEKEKAEVIRSFCLEYINTKYKSKLNTNK